MQSRIVTVVLAVIGIFALSATSALAGGGEGAASFNTFFECSSIDGGNVGEVVSIFDLGNDADPVRTGVRVGNGVLRCRQVNVKNSAGVFINGDLSSDELKCYSVSVKGPKAASQATVLQDDFLTETVNVSSSIQLLCGPTIPTAVP